MISKNTALVTAAVLAAGAQADLGLTQVYSDGLSPHYNFDDSSIPNPQTTQSNAISVPQQCQTYADMTNSDGSVYCSGSITAKSVTYSDCSGTFEFCTCDSGSGNTSQPIDDLIAQWGRIPPAFKENVRYIMGYTATSRWAETFTDTGDQIFFGMPTDDGIDVYLHESGHAMDQGNSSTSAWSDAVNKDGAVPDSYADTNLVEDFAQVGVVKTWLAYHNNQAPDSTSLSPLTNSIAYWEGAQGLSDADLSVASCDPGIKGAHSSYSKKRRGLAEKRDGPGPSIKCALGRGHLPTK